MRCQVACDGRMGSQFHHSSVINQSFPSSCLPLLFACQVSVTSQQTVVSVPILRTPPHHTSVTGACLPAWLALAQVRAGTGVCKIPQKANCKVMPRSLLGASVFRVQSLQKLKAPAPLQPPGPGEGPGPGTRESDLRPRITSDTLGSQFVSGRQQLVSTEQFGTSCTPLRCPAASLLTNCCRAGCFVLAIGLFNGITIVRHYTGWLLTQCASDAPCGYWCLTGVCDKQTPSPF
jgi:hypothetical protein